MLYSFARVSAVLGMRRQDYFLDETAGGRLAVGVGLAAADGDEPAVFIARASVTSRHSKRRSFRAPARAGQLLLPVHRYLS